MSGPVALRAGSLAAEFLSEQGMLGASLTIEGVEVLGGVGDIESKAAAGHTCGIPLLYPWANRLADHGYEVLGKKVLLESPLLNHDDAGLPNHGVPWSRLCWQVREHDQGSVTAELAWVGDQLLAVFPFPHRVVMHAALDERGLTIQTIVDADAGSDVPISFGFHPYFEVPGVSRREWLVQLPAMRRLVADSSMIPTGESLEADACDRPMGVTTFDDGFELLGPGAEFRIAAGSRSIAVQFGEGFTHAQLFAPPGKDFMAIEPMTAAVNALRSGDGLRILPAGDRFTATFRVELR